MYEVGDKVYIKTDIDENEWPYVDPIMRKYYGTEHEIKEVSNNNGQICYRLSGVYNWVWAENWLEPINNYSVEETDIENIIMN
jgi:hypothetical protein